MTSAIKLFGSVQIVTLTLSGNAFKPKECKFKVQIAGAEGGKGKHAQPKTVAKTHAVDLTKYCSEIGLAREQMVEVPLM